MCSNVEDVPEADTGIREGSSRQVPGSSSYRGSGESVTGAETTHPSGCASRGYGERNPHQVSPPIIKADLRERMLPHGKENLR